MAEGCQHQTILQEKLYFILMSRVHHIQVFSQNLKRVEIEKCNQERVCFAFKEQEQRSHASEPMNIGMSLD